MNASDVDARKRVVIVGGGLSGMSAAEALARQHGDRLKITLLEAKRTLGGRAGSFSDPSTGETVDYCQHVAMGCCTNLIGLLERCGLAHTMQRYTELEFLHPDFPPSRFIPSRWLPAPLHLARTITSLRYLSRAQCRQIRSGLLKLVRSPSDSLGMQTAENWLRENGQDAETIRDFWSVILVSALGEQTDAVSMAAARKVFVDGFAAARGASDLLIPKLPLAELFGQRLREELRTLGVDVLAGDGVKRIARSGSNIAIETNRGIHHEADHVVVAVPWHCVADLVSPDVLPSVGQFAEFPASPITGLHLWFDRELTDRPHAVMVGTVAQWLFRQPWEDRSSDCEAYYQVVISGSRQARSVAKETLVEKVLAELRDAFPAAKDAKLLRSRRVTDPHSVFSIRPEVDAVRPSARTPLPWLHLAGDWIATGWPSTMEGAVISGRMAASSVAEHEGWSPTAVDPGLPRGWLARRICRP